MEPFVESGMIFGPYAEGNCFRIEQSKTYLAIQDNVKIAEFLLYRLSERGVAQIWIVEAKQSSPRPTTQPAFNEFINDIRDKLSNTLALGTTSILGRHALAANELSPIFQSIDLTNVEFRLILIINGHQKDWLPPLQDALNQYLHDIVKTWSLGPKSVVVINHEEALSHNLISGLQSFPE